MTTRSQRKQQMKYAHITAIVVGIFIALCGLFFIAVISGETDQKNSECVEKTTGTISNVAPSGSKYIVTIDYVAEDVDCQTSVEMKDDPDVGGTLDVYYEPLTVRHIYIPGVTKTGINDVVTGIIMILVGGVFIVLGVILKKMKKSDEK